MLFDQAAGEVEEGEHPQLDHSDRPTLANRAQAAIAKYLLHLRAIFLLEFGGVEEQQQAIDPDRK